VTQVAIGVDVGGTKTALGLVDPDGTLRDRDRIRNADLDGDDALLRAIADRCTGLARATQVSGIGVALPEVLDPAGELQSHVSLRWTKGQIIDALAHIGPITLEADVRAAALAEARIGAGRGRSSVGYVSVGTGVSAALVLDGIPYAGAHGAAQLLGSAELPIACPHCGRRFRAPALENVAAGPALVERYNREADPAIASGEELLAAARTGDPVAERILRDGAETLGGYLALFVNIVDPEILVVGGGLGAAFGDRLPAIVSAARDHIWATHVHDVPIVPAALGEDAGVIGAGLLVVR
jgi:glucokinase